MGAIAPDACSREVWPSGADRRSGGVVICPYGQAVPHTPTLGSNNQRVVVSGDSARRAISAATRGMASTGRGPPS